MATPVQQNLESKNKEYASNFTQRDLALPPAKKYAVGTFGVLRRRQGSPLYLPIMTNPNVSIAISDLHGRSY